MAVAVDDAVEGRLRLTWRVGAEWPEDAQGPSQFVLTTRPRRLTKKAIVRILKERWRTERAYEKLKGELGLDPLRGTLVPWLASPCHRGPLLLRFHRF